MPNKGKIESKKGFSMLVKEDKLGNCKIAVTVINQYFFGDTVFFTTDSTVMEMETMTIREFSKAYNTYRSPDMRTSPKEVFNLYKQCGDYPRCLEMYLDSRLDNGNPKYFTIEYVYNLAKYFGYNYEIIFDFLVTFTKVALTQNFTLTNITFDLTDYLDRTYFGYTFKYEQIREILEELITYGILAKESVYDIRRENYTEYYTLHFTDILFHNYFSQDILCPKKTKTEADLTFYVYDSNRAECLSKDRNVFLYKCTNEDERFSQDPSTGDDATSEVLFVLQKTKSGKSVYITFSEEMENALLAKYPNFKVLRYSERKIHKLYGLKKKKK